MTDLLAQLQSALGDTFVLERELGGGGMSRVFLATERALGRRVVVKVLTPELAQGLSAERFAREIRLAAALQEPHIVPVLVAGDAGGLPYFTMPYVEGESLRARLLRGPLPFPEALGILRDVALALEYAHARGIVHRDIKPENVLLSGRTAVVADFGIAKALSAARTEGPRGASGTLTSIGQSLGTPAYMAPEQAAGDPTDHRADLYAWGMMAYELLAGRHPFAEKATTAQLMAAQVMESPAPLAEQKPGLPLPIAALVMQCLEKEMSARPQSAAELLQSLDGIGSPGAASVARPAAAKAREAAAPPAAGRRAGPPWALVGGAVVAILAIGGFLMARRGGSAADAPASGSRSVATSVSTHSIAVLPFENLGDSSEAYFADGITDAVRGKLTALPGVEVIARGSSVQYRGTTKLPGVIAGELGVRYLLTGTVRFAGVGSAKRVQVSPELVEILAGGKSQSRWQEPFDAEVKDVFTVQGEIAGKVAEAMRVALGGAAQAQLAKAPTADPLAYDAYLRGQAAWNAGASRDPASLRRAIAFFEQAVARDSALIDAWGAIAQASGYLYSNASPTSQIARVTQEAARRAAALDPSSAIAHMALATYHRTIERKLSSALAELELARKASPRDAEILAEIANAKGEQGRLEEELRDREAAILIDPRSPRIWSGLAIANLRLRRYPDARRAAERALALAPNSLNAMLNRLLSYAGEGDVNGARQAIAAASKEFPPEQVEAYVATYWDMGWVLDAPQQRQVLAFAPDAFDDDRATWAIVRAQLYQLDGASALSRAWGDTAAREFGRQVKLQPEDPQLHVLHGLALAYAGRAADARGALDRGIALQLASEESRRSVNYGYYAYVAARALLLLGDTTAALGRLEEVLSLPFFVSRAWLRVDPTWASLRGNPRFEKLVAGA